MSPRRQEVEFSEFSYGFALTRELIEHPPTSLRIAPQFPSLQEEGRPGGGYDVSIPFVGRPLLIQFKIPQVMVRRSSNMPQGFTPVYYRMHLRRRNLSIQHRELLAHARAGRLVYYASPSFHSSSDLNRFYRTGRVAHHTGFFSPGDIGDLMDDDPHHVAYNAGIQAWLRSKPRLLKENVAWEGFGESLRIYASKKLTRAEARAEWRNFALSTLEETEYMPNELAVKEGKVRDSDLLNLAVSYCRSHLNAQVFTVEKRKGAA